MLDPCKRRVFVTLQHGELPRAITEHDDANLGVVCAVVGTGAVKRGMR